MKSHYTRNLSKLKALALFGAIVVLAPRAQADQEQLKLSCANSSRDSIVDKAAAEFEKQSGVKIVKYDENVRKQSNSEYFKDLLDGRVDAACASLAYVDWLAIMKADSVPVPGDAQITQRVIGKDLIYVVANKATGVTELTYPQLEMLFSGSAKNWKQVGGADLPVVLLSSKDKKNNRNALSKIVMAGKPFRSDFTELPSVKDSMEKIETTPGGFFVLGEKIQSPNILVVKTPELGRPVTLITKGRPSPTLERFIQFVRKLGGVGQ